MDDNDDAESQKFLSNGMMKKKKYEEYHEEYVRIHNANVVCVCQSDFESKLILKKIESSLIYFDAMKQFSISKAGTQ